MKKLFVPCIYKVYACVLFFMLGWGMTFAQQEPSLTVTSPNGGEQILSGQSFTITWTSSNVTGNVVIELLQNDSLVGVIASAVPVANGQYTWTGGRLVDGTPVSGTGFKIRVNAAMPALDASFFGFDANAANNFTAMRAMEVYANTMGKIAVKFQPGTYTVQLPITGEPGYRGGQQAACLMNNVNGVSIDASQAEFYIPNSVGVEQSLFSFIRCTNINLKANFRGVHNGHTHTGIKGVYLQGYNSYANLTINSDKMYDAVRVGNWEDPVSVPSALYDGNHDITINVKSTDTYYTVPVYLTSNVTITCEAVGTAAGNYGACRAVYLDGCTNVVATSRTRDMDVQDGVNIIGTAPTVLPPYHVGSSDVTLTATDMGSTYYVQYQSLVKFNVVLSSKNGISAITKNVNVHVDVLAAGDIWKNNGVVTFGSLGDGAAHRYENITISGVVDRSASPRVNNALAIYVEESEGLSYLDLTLNGFHDRFDTLPPLPYTIYVASKKPTVEINAYNSDVGRVYLADTTKQTFINH